MKVEEKRSESLTPDEVVGSTQQQQVTRARQNMDVYDKLEIYIPAEAEVKNIPLWSLANSVLRRMGLAVSDSERSRKLTDSPVATWICPVVIRRKGQKQASHTGNSVAENMSSLLSEFPATTGPLRMSFVISNHNAYKVLKDVGPGKHGSHNSHTSLLPQSAAPQTYRTAVIIYNGSIYLSIRKQSRKQRQKKTRDPQLTDHSSVPSTSSAKTWEKKLLNDNRPKKKRIKCKVAENKQDVMYKVREVSSPKTARSVPRSTDSVHKVNRHCHEDAGGEQATEETPAWFQSWVGPEVVTNRDGGECEMMENMGGEEVECTSQNGNNWMESSIQINSDELNQSYGRTEPVAAACSSTSVTFDFNELEQEEEIAQMKARLKQNKAALKDTGV